MTSQVKQTTFSGKIRQLRNNTQDYVAYVFIRIFFVCVGCLPVDKASAFGGWSARTFLGFYRRRVAHRNLELVFPELSIEKREILRLKSIEGLGRTLGEMPHAKAFLGENNPRMRYEGAWQQAREAFERGESCLFLSGHYGNWEFGSAVKEELKVAPQIFYSPLNNKYLDRFLLTVRLGYGAKFLNRKDRKSLRKALDALQNAGSVGMLLDQRMGSGRASFFGRSVRVSTVPLSLIKRTNCNVFMFQNIRVDGAYFIQKLHGPFHKAGEEVSETFLEDLNRMYEGMIKETPSQWFWQHRRFDKEEYKKNKPVSKEKSQL